MGLIRRGSALVRKDNGLAGDDCCECVPCVWCGCVENPPEIVCNPLATIEISMDYDGETYSTTFTAADFAGGSSAQKAVTGSNGSIRQLGVDFVCEHIPGVAYFDPRGVFVQFGLEGAYTPTVPYSLGESSLIRVPTKFVDDVCEIDGGVVVSGTLPLNEAWMFRVDIV